VRHAGGPKPCFHVEPFASAKGGKKGGPLQISPWRGEKKKKRRKKYSTESEGGVRLLFHVEKEEEKNKTEVIPKRGREGKGLSSLTAYIFSFCKLKRREWVSELLSIKKESLHFFQVNSAQEKELPDQRKRNGGEKEKIQMARKKKKKKKSRGVKRVTQTQRLLSLPSEEGGKKKKKKENVPFLAIGTEEKKKGSFKGKKLSRT